MHRTSSALSQDKEALEEDENHDVDDSDDGTQLQNTEQNSENVSVTSEPEATEGIMVVLQTKCSSNTVVKKRQKLVAVDKEDVGRSLINFMQARSTAALTNMNRFSCHWHLRIKPQHKVDCKKAMMKVSVITNQQAVISKLLICNMDQGRWQCNEGFSCAALQSMYVPTEESFAMCFAADYTQQ